jgi:hypothetical protein
MEGAASRTNMNFKCDASGGLGFITEIAVLTTVSRNDDDDDEGWQNENTVSLQQFEVYYVTVTLPYI